MKKLSLLRNMLIVLITFSMGCSTPNPRQFEGLTPIQPALQGVILIEDIRDTAAVFYWYETNEWYIADFDDDLLMTNIRIYDFSDRIGKRPKEYGVD